MLLKTLKLSNFRNYTKLEYQFEAPITVLRGDNAQGKSNFLESIYFLATTKSPKAERDTELIQKGEGAAHLEGILSDETNLEISMLEIEGSFQKRMRVNGVARRSTDYIGHLSAVLFAPEDINLITGSPSLRRWHIDLTLAPIDRQYKNILTTYEQVVINKNRVLKRIKEGFAQLRELEYWAEQQVSLGAIISQKRQELFNFLNQTEHRFGNFAFDYHPSLISSERLEQYLDREIASSTSLIGPHRDDFVFLFNNQELAKFGSRGEQRTAVLDLKLSEVEFMERQSGKRPILLLDDVFSELDAAHRNHVLDLSRLQQTVITTVELDGELTDFFDRHGQIHKVEQGSLHSLFAGKVQ